MNKLWIVAKNEFYRYFTSPLAYVYLISFLLLNGSFAFYFGHFFETGQANLLSMFSFQPWLYLLFIPGISMRLWAEEFRTKTVLQIVTMPVSLGSLVWGKYLAAWAFCGIALLLTFPFWITVNLLGTPDNWVIFGSCCGSFLLAGAMLAISQTMSALTKNQVIALVLSVFANLLFFLSGLEYVLDVFRAFLPPFAIDTIASFSFLSHFETVSYGLIELRDIVFFVSLILMFNFMTVLIISFKTAGTTAWFKSTQTSFYVIVFVCLLAGFAGLNMIANTWLRSLKIDFTEEKIFTLTPATENILQNLPNRVTAKLYFSPVIAERSPQTRLLFDKVRLLLEQYGRLSGGRLTLQLLNPEPLSRVEDEAVAGGLQPFPLVDSNVNAYFGLIFVDEADNRQVIRLFPPERAGFLEQDLTEALYLLGRPKKNLGILTSLPMFEDVIENVATPQWEIVSLLQKFYNVRRVDNGSNNLDGLDALLIVHPRELSADTVEKIKKYNIGGGKVLAFFDIAPEAVRIFAPSTDVLKPSDYDSLSDFWGIRYVSKAVVADFDNSTLIDASLDYRHNPEFTQDVIQFYLPRAAFNPQVPATRLLKKMLLTSGSVFVPVKEAPVDIVPLLTIGGNSQLFSADVVYKNVHPSYMLRNFKADDKLKLFSAYVKSRDPERPFEMIAVGDSDLLYDNFWMRHNTILGTSYAVPILDNANFVLNALDFLTGDNTLVPLRGKSGIDRPFAKVENIRRQALQNFKIQEVDIFSNIEKAKAGLEEITAKRRFEGRENFSVDELALIAKIRRQLDDERLKLLTIRTGLNQEIDKILGHVKFFNIYAVPLLILAVLLLLRLRRGVCLRLERPRFNAPLLLVIGSGTLLLLAGLAATRSARETTAPAEEKPLFAAFAEKINQIDTLTFRSRARELTLRRRGNLWEIEGQPHIMANQQRIARLLATLLSGRLLEQRTAKLENFDRFGLTPLSAEASQITELELSSGSKKLYGLEIGRYDIDLGRGRRGAYVKFPGSYEVWLSDLDLINLDLDWRNWSFSRLWDLHFGRFASINGSRDPAFLADMARLLLNTPFVAVAADMPAPSEKLQTLRISAEDGSELELEIFRAQDKIYARYRFLKTAAENDLQIFAGYAKPVFYEIPENKWKEIADVIAGHNAAE